MELIEQVRTDHQVDDDNLFQSLGSINLRGLSLKEFQEQHRIDYDLLLTEAKRLGIPLKVLYEMVANAN
jgi:hypothetical protein